MNKSTLNENDLPKESNFDTIIINTYFDVKDLHNTSTLPDNSEYVKKTLDLINRCESILKNGGVLFIYGLPKYLPLFGIYLNNTNHFLFKYWIGIELKESKEYNKLHNKHIGMLMYLKTPSSKSPLPFNLNTKRIREQYRKCNFCDENIRDWGGKKHLMNPIGSAFSDIWDFTHIDMGTSNSIPDDVVDRIVALREKQNSRLLVIKQNKLKIDYTPDIKLIHHNIQSKKINEVYLGDCIEHLNKLKKEFPQGVFDLVFADPPYNLSKSYNNYKDSQDEESYIRWCDAWLHAMYENLRPGGALLVLNIPKWSLYHARSLLKKMNFEHWIIWDALSTPAGKLLPSHYTLLYFTKPGGKITNNYELLKNVDHRNYCLRLSCIRNRKVEGYDEIENMGDVWRNVHRIKHKKDRDSHPCQLPIKLMDRIITLFTNKGDIVYDPFGGAGTTAISARKLGRNFIVSELDKKYVDIIHRNLSKLQLNLDGEFNYVREPIRRKSKAFAVPRRTVEMRYFEICKENKKVLEKEEVRNLNQYIFSLLDEYNGSFAKLKNVCQRKFDAEKLIAK